jgi:hypothetical protein
MKTTKLTIEEHRELGAELKTVRSVLMKRSVQVGNTYGVTAKTHRRIDKALRALEGAKSELENQLFLDHPKEATHGVYYEGGRP